MPRDISSFRAQLTGSGARPNLFQIIARFPLLAASGAADAQVTFMAESSSLPSDKIGEIEVAYQGRKTYYPGDREFDPWTVTIINDETFFIRDAFERWMSGLNSHLGNIRNPIAATTAGYSTDWYIQQLSKIDGPPIKSYKMTACFPTQLDAIELDWGTNNTIEKFNVTLRYQWWAAIGPTGPTTDDSLAALAG